MKLLKKFMVLLLTVAIGVALTGCSKTYLTELSPQSHFNYPNSNVKPMGKVRGEASKSSFLGHPDDDSSLMKEAIANALAQKPGSDLLLNYVVLNKRTTFLFVTTLTKIVEGTAAKSEIGSQKLK